MATVERLSGWKAIGRFLGRDPRTAQLWERHRSLPVHRIPGGPGQTVFAFRHELAAWLARGQIATGAPVIAAEAPAATAAVPGLLVLPFRYLAADPAYAFVADALTDEITSRLATTQLDSMRVLSTTTAKTYSNCAVRAHEVAAELGVAYLVEGTVHAAGARWRVDVRVVDARRDAIVFTDRFSCPYRDVLVLQAQIASAIAEALQLRLAGAPLEPFWSEPVDPAAYLCFLDAVRLAGRGTLDGYEVACERLDEAGRIDPSYVPARTMRAYIELSRIAFTRNFTAQSLAGLRRRVEACVAEAPQLLRTRIVESAFYSWFDHDWDRCRATLESIATAVPANVEARFRLCSNSSLLREFDRASAAIEPALVLESSPMPVLGRACMQMWRRDYGEATAGFDRVLAREPTHAFANFMKVFTLGIYGGDVHAARVHMDTMPLAVRQKYEDMLTGCLCAVEGRPDEARAHQRQVIARAHRGDAFWYHAAMIDGLLGDGDGAAQRLATAATAHDFPRVVAAVDPCLDRVRDHAGVRRQLRMLNLPC